MAIQKNHKGEITSDDIKSVLADESSNPNEETREEEEYYNKDIVKDIKLEELKTLKQHNAILEQNKEERKKYAKHIFILTCIWAALIFVVIFFVGFSLINLSDKVLITLISSTTINFFGFFLLVVKYLFNTGSDKRTL